MDLTLLEFVFNQLGRYVRALGSRKALLRGIGFISVAIVLMGGVGSWAVVTYGLASGTFPWRAFLGVWTTAVTLGMGLLLLLVIGIPLMIDQVRYAWLKIAMTVLVLVLLGVTLRWLTPLSEGHPSVRALFVAGVLVTFFGTVMALFDFGVIGKRVMSLGLLLAGLGFAGMLYFQAKPEATQVLESIRNNFPKEKKVDLQKQSGLTSKTILVVLTRTGELRTIDPHDLVGGYKQRYSWMTPTGKVRVSTFGIERCIDGPNNPNYCDVGRTQGTITFEAIEPATFLFTAVRVN